MNNQQYNNFQPQNPNFIPPALQNSSNNGQPMFPLPTAHHAPQFPMLATPSSIVTLQQQQGVPGSSQGMPNAGHVGQNGGSGTAAPQSLYCQNTLVPVAQNVVRPRLQNIVCTVNLDCKLDLKKIALHARNAEYNPKRFAAVIMRIREPRTTALIFSSGKMVCTGAKSEILSKMSARKYGRIIQKLGFPVKFKDFKIQNMVGSCDVGFPIRLEGLVLAQGQFCSYEPELFPGLIYRMVKPKIVLLVFVSGKVVLTGAKERSEIEEAFDSISPILRGFRKQ